MNRVQYILADETHIGLLIEARIAFFLELNGPQSIGAVTALKDEIRAYLNVAIKEKSYVGVLAIAAAGGMVIRQRPGSFINPSGREAYIMSMYTALTYRKQGLATQILNKLVEQAKGMGIITIELHATQDGEPVYKKYGFKLHTEPTYRLYINRD
jgi:GNAT superfamily N-acetyltransferase